MSLIGCWVFDVECFLSSVIPLPQKKTCIHTVRRENLDMPAMKSFIAIILVALALVFANSASAQGNIAGAWKSQFDSQIGTQNYTYTFKVDGTNLTGRAYGIRQNGTNDVAITDGTIDGDKISFNEALVIQDNTIIISYTGTIAGDQLKLHRKVGDFAEYDIVANRVTDTSAATQATNETVASGMTMTIAGTPSPTYQWYFYGSNGLGTTNLTLQSQSTVDGKWQGQFDSQIGTQNYTYTFKVDGTNLTGRAYGIRENGTNDVAITEGTIDGGKISFVEPLSFNGNDIRIEYTGTVSGDEIKLHRKVGGFAEEDLVVKRVQDQ